MNNSKQDILNNLIKEPFINQRILAAQTGHSLGIVNRSIKELISEGYLDEEIRPTEKALREAKEKAPKNAIILAAGFGMRMVPINTETPKGLLEIKGERLIECTIRPVSYTHLDYLWINSRVKGGAYGCGGAFGRGGNACISSYRDPNVGRTLEVYRGIGDYVRNFEADERQMTKYIIGTISELDVPMNPSAKGQTSESAWFNGITEADFQQERDQILDATRCV